MEGVRAGSGWEVLESCNGEGVHWEKVGSELLASTDCRERRMLEGQSSSQSTCNMLNGLGELEKYGLHVCMVFFNNIQGS